MAATKYTFALSSFPNGACATDRLQQEIRASEILTALDRIDTAGSDVDIWFRDALSTGDETILGALVAAHSGAPLPDGSRDAFGNPVVGLSTRQADGTSLVAVKSRFGREVIYATHNFCDPTTWYSESERVTDKALTDNAGTWESGDPNWIDLDHGKVFDEDAVKADQAIFDPPPHGYAILVTVDGVEKTARAPWASSGGDFTVNYAAGTITPTTEDWTGKTVLVSYSKATTSAWIVTPSEERALIIEAAEIQFAGDVVLNASLRMEVYGLVDFFAPQLLQANGGPLPSGTPIPIEETLYKTIDQLIDEAIGAYPVIPAFSNAAGRGYTQPRHIFQFHYASARAVYSSLGMFIRISIEGDQPFGGERATATFYCLSKIDPGPAAALLVLTDASGD